MKYLPVIVSLLFFSCSSVVRVAPRDFARVRAEEQEKAELVSAIESEVAESNRLRDELTDSTEEKAETPEPTALAVDAGYTPRLIVFTAIDWCVPCQKLDAELKRLGEMAYVGPDGKRHTWSEKIGRSPDNAIQVIDISDDSDAGSHEIALKYLVGAVPTMVRLDVDGKQESRFSGLIDAETICRYQAGKWKPPKQAVEAKDIVSQLN